MKTYPTVDSGQILSASSLMRMKLSAVSTVFKSGNCSATVASPSSLSSVKGVSMTTRGAHNSGLVSSTAVTSLSPIELSLSESTRDLEGVTVQGSTAGT